MKSAFADFELVVAVLNGVTLAATWTTAACALRSRRVDEVSTEFAPAFGAGVPAVIRRVVIEPIVAIAHRKILLHSPLPNLPTNGIKNLKISGAT